MTSKEKDLNELLRRIRATEQARFVFKWLMIVLNMIWMGAVVFLVFKPSQQSFLFGFAMFTFYVGIKIEDISSKTNLITEMMMYLHCESESGEEIDRGVEVTQQ